MNTTTSAILPEHLTTYSIKLRWTPSYLKSGKGGISRLEHQLLRHVRSERVERDESVEVVHSVLEGGEVGVGIKHDVKDLRCDVRPCQCPERDHQQVEEDLFLRKPLEVVVFRPHGEGVRNYACEQSEGPVHAADVDTEVVGTFLVTVVADQIAITVGAEPARTAVVAA